MIVSLSEEKSINLLQLCFWVVNGDRITLVFAGAAELPLTTDESATFLTALRSMSNPRLVQPVGNPPLF